MSRLVDSVAAYLKRQIDAGCQAVQIFDSWAGCLSPATIASMCCRIRGDCSIRLPADVPTIHFLTGNPALLALQAEGGGQVMGLDWRCDLGTAARPERAVQGNLDPVTLLADTAAMEERPTRCSMPGDT